MKTNIKEKIQQKNTCQAIIIRNRNKETKTKLNKIRNNINKQKTVKRKQTTKEIYKKRSEIVNNASY